MNTITQEQQAAISAKLENMDLPRGMGDEHAACSIAAINLALTGQLTDEIPECMSKVIGRWIIPVQDAMPDAMRNSVKWKSLLPLAAGTGRDYEEQRLALIMDWMWGAVLPSLQARADAGGYGPQWRAMCAERTEAAAEAAAWGAEAADAAADAADAAAAWAAAAWAAEAWAEAEAAEAAAAWEKFDPCALLARLVEVGND